MENYYETIGVSENATQEEIKKAYKKKAIQHHPDKGGDEEMFKKISVAFDTIGDENKRSQYDNQRRNPFANMGGGGFNPFEEMFNQSFNTQRRTVPDTIIDVQIGTLESFNSNDKTVTYTRKHKCNDCNGNGGERITCNICNGEGFTIQRMGTGIFVQVVRQVCNGCKGNGFHYKNTCRTCHGETTKNVIETLSIKIPHGIDNGQFLKLQEKGDFNGGMYGNLILKVNIQPESGFEKSGNDLVYNAYFNLEDLSKPSFTIPHPKGNISIKLPSDFDTSKPLRIKSKGFFDSGDLFIKLYVKFTRK